MPPLRSIDPQRASSPPFHRSSGVISAEDRVDRLEACTASLPPEAVELDAQQEEVTAVQPEVRQPEPSVESARTAAVRFWFRATSPWVLVPASPMAPAVEQQAPVVRLWCPGQSASAFGREQAMVWAKQSAAADP